MEWLRYTARKDRRQKRYDDGCSFFIPFVAPEDDDDDDDGMEEDEVEKQPLLILKDWMVCKDAISILLDYGQKKWKTCQKAVLLIVCQSTATKGSSVALANRSLVK